MALKTHERLAAAWRHHGIDGQNRRQAGSAGGASGGLPLARRARLSIHALPAIVVLGLRDGASALLEAAVWSQVLDEAELLDIGVARSAAARALAEGHRHRPRRWPALMLECAPARPANLVSTCWTKVTGRRKVVTRPRDGREDACLMDKPLGDGHD